MATSSMQIKNLAFIVSFQNSFENSENIRLTLSIIRY